MDVKTLITGGLGFIGSNYIDYILETKPLENLLVLDKKTYAADPDALKRWEGNTRLSFIEGDVCDAQLLCQIFLENNIQGVVHFAAESHVDNSISGPQAFVETNIMGTFQLLEAARKTWLDRNQSKKAGYENARFHHISTDEVYGALGPKGAFTEKTAYAPNSPYSASKAASDHLVRSYFHTYGLPVVTTNCSNNFGPYQHQEKLIPTIIRKAIQEEPIPIYGTGKNIRDWLFVLDHCIAIQTVFEKGTLGEVYCVGGDSEKTNLDLCAAVIQILDNTQPRSNRESYATLITHVTDRLGHDFRYAIDATKIKNELGWSAQTSFEEALQITVEHYLNKRNR
ncbi:MAG: dTDP-glucose 4,6-dehydratase [Flavobacteriales bacterium]|jgi:dTDP-glucose 4,6-dehydratase|tara:strand:+ start:584 stop:1603 length:1020 start_codon:yes stop_codon:yes gene_type:complete